MPPTLSYKHDHLRVLSWCEFSFNVPIGGSTDLHSKSYPTLLSAHESLNVYYNYLLPSSTSPRTKSLLLMLTKVV